MRWAGPRPGHGANSAPCKLLEGRSVLVIAHRLSTVRRADKIVVLSKGQIAEMGSHDELMAMGGQYAELYTMGFAEDEEPEA